MALDKDKIRAQGVKIIEEFSRKLKDIPETRETHYVVDMRNVTRADAEPVDCPGFRGKMRKIAPRWEENSVVAEKGVE